MLPLGNEPLSIPLPELFTDECALWWKPVMHCAGSQSTVGTATGPGLSHGSASIWPWCPLGVVSQGPVQIPLKSGPRTIAVMRVNPLWPTAACANPVPASYWSTCCPLGCLAGAAFTKPVVEVQITRTHESETFWPCFLDCAAPWTQPWF